VDVTTAKYLLSKGVDIKARNKDGDTALQIAESIGYLDMISFLKSKMK
jgi:ankyrin repeat protein